MMQASTFKLDNPLARAAAATEVLPLSACHIQDVDTWYSSLPHKLQAFKDDVLGGMNGAFLADEWTVQVTW